MTGSPKVSAVLTSFNQPDLLETAFRSLVEQTYDNLEIVVVDDCSSDPGNKMIIEKYRNERPGTIVKYQDRHAGVAKNKSDGFRLATGELITYLDGDDLYYPDKLKNEVECMLAGNWDVVYSNFNFIDEKGQVTKAWTDQEMPSGKIFSEIVHEAFPGGILFRFELMKRELLAAMGYYDERLHIYEDWDLRIRYGAVANVGYCNQVGSAYRRNSSSIVSTASLAGLLDQRRVVIQKNAELIRQHLQSETFLKDFERSYQVKKLFDVKYWTPGRIIASGLKNLIRYPSSAASILGAWYYFFKMRGKRFVK